MLAKACWAWVYIKVDCNASATLLLYLSEALRGAVGAADGVAGRAQGPAEDLAAAHRADGGRPGPLHDGVLRRSADTSFQITQPVEEGREKTRGRKYVKIQYKRPPTEITSGRKEKWRPLSECECSQVWCCTSCTHLGIIWDGAPLGSNGSNVDWALPPLSLRLGGKKRKTVSLLLIHTGISDPEVR